MPATRDLSVAEAAERLGVSPQRVRAMIRDGGLDAAKMGHSWFISADSVANRQRGGVRPGRLLTPRNAWAMLFLNSGESHLEREASKWLSPWMRWYLTNRAKREDWSTLAPRLRRRASTHRLRAHPSDLPRLAAEEDVVRTGVSAAQDHSLDVAAPGILEAYVPARRLPRLRKKYLLEPSVSPNVILHVVEDHWPFARDCAVAPALVAALDLLDSDDQRSRRAAKRFLAKLKSA